MPPNKTDEELAREFANYFLDKIEKKSDQSLLPLSHTLLMNMIHKHYEYLLHLLNNRHAY